MLNEAGVLVCLNEDEQLLAAIAESEAEAAADATPAAAPSPAPAPAMPPAAATVTSNASARPQVDPHGNGVRIGESDVPAPSRKRHRRSVRNWIALKHGSDNSDVTEAELMARAMAEVSAEVAPLPPTPAPVPTPSPLAPAPSAVQTTNALAEPAPASSTAPAVAPLPVDAAPSPAPPLPSPARDVVIQRPATPNENGLDSANPGNKMGDGPSGVSSSSPTPRERGAADAVNDLLGTATHTRAAHTAPSLLLALSFPRDVPPNTPTHLPPNRQAPQRGGASLIAALAHSAPRAPPAPGRGARPTDPPASPQRAAPTGRSLSSPDVAAAPLPARATSTPTQVARLHTSPPTATRRPADTPPRAPPRGGPCLLSALAPLLPHVAPSTPARPLSAVASAVWEPHVHPATAPQSGPDLPSGVASLLDILRRDTSKYALCPGNPERLEALARSVERFTRLAVPRSTARKDVCDWRAWCTLARFLNTAEWRDCTAAHSGLDQHGARREQLLQCIFVLYKYVTGKPRHAGRARIKPGSARAPLDSVRRIHKRNGITIIAAPAMSTLMKGLLREYVRIHGADVLVPCRREPLTNEQMAAIARIPAGTKLGPCTVSPTSTLWRNYIAFNTTCRHAGTRCADLLCAEVHDFDVTAMSLDNLYWHLGAAGGCANFVKSPTPADLRRLAPGDSAVLRPGCTKADPFALEFGDKPIYLPWDAGDITNAAAWLARNELARQVPAEQRRATPLFVADDAGTPLTHAVARAIFDAAKNLCFAPDVAKFLSLHSCRVWLACALLSAGKSDPTIMACCRWLCTASVRSYAHMNPGDYRRHLQDAIAAPITSRLASTLACRMSLDNDAAARAVSAEFGDDGNADSVATVPDAASRVSPAVAAPRGRQPASTPPSIEPADTAAQHTGADADGSDSSDTEDPDSFLCDAGPLLADEALIAGAHVACPFTVNGVEVHCPGILGARRAADEHWKVAFYDGDTWFVRRDRLFRVVDLAAA